MEQGNVKVKKHKAELTDKDGRLCVVCGDNASSINFGVLTCDPCKAFFRRNAHKDSLLDLCGNNCVINKDSRSSCKSCRLKKCFIVGMAKNLIWTPAEREKRKQKIEENRQKRQSSVDTPVFEEPNLDSLGATDGFQGAYISSLKSQLAIKLKRKTNLVQRSLSVTDASESIGSESSSPRASMSSDKSEINSPAVVKESTLPNLSAIRSPDTYEPTRRSSSEICTAINEATGNSISSTATSIYSEKSVNRESALNQKSVNNENTRLFEILSECNSQSTVTDISNSPPNVKLIHPEQVPRVVYNKSSQNISSILVNIPKENHRVDSQTNPQTHISETKINLAAREDDVIEQKNYNSLFSVIPNDLILDRSVICGSQSSDSALKTKIKHGIGDDVSSETYSQWTNTALKDTELTPESVMIAKASFNHVHGIDKPPASMLQASFETSCGILPDKSNEITGKSYKRDTYSSQQTASGGSVTAKPSHTGSDPSKMNFCLEASLNELLAPEINVSGNEHISTNNISAPSSSCTVDFNTDSKQLCASSDRLAPAISNNPLRYVNKHENDTIVKNYSVPEKTVNETENKLKCVSVESIESSYSQSLNREFLLAMDQQLAYMLQQIGHAFSLSYDKALVEKIQEKPNLPQCFNQLEGFIRKSVMFAKQLPAFKSLCPGDQLELTKCAFLEMTTVHLTKIYNPSNISFYIKHRPAENPHTEVVIETSIAAVCDNEFGVQMMNSFNAIYYEFQKVTKRDPVIKMCLLTQMLFTPRPGITYEDEKHIKYHYDLTLRVLQNYMSIVYDDSSFSDVTAFIPKLREVAQFGQIALQQAPTPFLSPFTLGVKEET